MEKTESFLNCTCPTQSTFYNCSTFHCQEMVVYFTEESIVLLHALYVAILTTGLLGNMLTCTVIILRKCMRRSIHFYTFNLAICDLLILFFYVPTQMVYVQHQLEWTMGLVMCKVAYVILPVSLVSTIGTLLAITFDRARGLIQPFKWRSDSLRNAKLIIPSIWFLAILVNIPLFIFPRIDYDGETTVCSEGWPKTEYETVFWVSMFVLVFAVPLLVIVVTHVIMVGVTMRDSSTIQRQHNKRMIRMVVALVIVFSVCTGFQHVYFFMATFSKVNLTHQSSALLFGISNFVVSLQASLNPIIYGTLRQDFKKAFSAIIVKIMFTLKLRRESYNNDRLFMNSKFSSTFDTPVRTSSRAKKLDWNTTDSPLISPRESFRFNTETHLVANTKETIKISNFRRKLMLKYEQRGYTISPSKSRLCSYMPVPLMNSGYEGCMSKRISKIFEHLNRSKETIL